MKNFEELAFEWYDTICFSDKYAYVWDEPLNFIDVYSRIQIEQLIEENALTMIFVEHDKNFILSLLMIISTAEFPKMIMTGCAARDLTTRSTVNVTRNQPER